MASEARHSSHGGGPLAAERPRAPRPEEARYLLAAIVEASEDAVVSATLDGVLTSWNPAAERLFGFSAAEAIGAPITLFVPEDRLEERHAYIEKLRAGERVKHYDTVRTTKQGVALPVSISISGIHDATGELIGVAAIARDISERRRAETALRESERHFRRLADSAPVLVWMSGRDKGGVYFNKTWLDFTGRSLEGELGEGWLQSIHRDDLPALEACAAAFAAHEPFTTEFRLRRRDGAWRWMLDTGVPRFEPDGSFAGYIGSCVDITERREAEALVRESEERFRALLDSLPQSVWLTTADGRVQYVNRRWFDYTGISAEDAARWPELVHPEDRRRHLAGRRASVRADRPFETQSRIRRTDGTYRWQLTRVVPLRGEDGRTFAWLGSWTDIDDMRRAEDALRDDEERFRLAQEAAAIGTYDWDVQNGLIRWSPEMFRLHGIDPRTPPDRLYDAWREALHPDDRERADRETHDFVEREGPLDIEFRVVLPGGGVRRIQGRGTLVRGRDGRPQRMIGVNIDVTERREAEEALRESEARLRRAHDGGGISDWEWSPQSGVLRWSESMYQLVGRDAATFDPHGERLADLVHPKDRERVVAELQEVVDGKRPRFDTEFRTVWPDGTVRWLTARADLVRDESGARARLVGISFDVTDRKRAEERQRLLINELNHRVKNTLATVQSLAAQSLRSASSSESFRAAFEARLIALSGAHDLLTHSSWAGAALHDVLEQALAPYRQREAAPARVRLRGEAVRLTPRAALTLGMAFHELATNATKYGALAAPAGRVEVSWHAEAAKAARRLRIEWREAGGPRVARPRRLGFGLRLIMRSIEEDLDGGVDLGFDPEGVRCALTIPLADGAGETA